MGVHRSEWGISKQVTSHRIHYDHGGARRAATPLRDGVPPREIWPFSRMVLDGFPIPGICVWRQITVF